MTVEKQEQLNHTFDVSSEKHRNFLFGFLTVQLYILITVGGTTDLDLVLASSSFNLPIVNVTVPLIAFYFFAPLLLLILHINLLFNLSEHVNLMNRWFKSKGDTALRFPYIINVIACMNMEQQQNTQLKLVRSIAVLSIILLPLFIFVSIQVRFSDYHNIWVTTCHAAIFIIDLWVIRQYVGGLKIDIFTGSKFE